MQVIIIINIILGVSPILFFFLLSDPADGGGKENDVDLDNNTICCYRARKSRPVFKTTLCAVTVVRDRDPSFLVRTGSLNTVVVRVWNCSAWGLRKVNDTHLPTLFIVLIKRSRKYNSNVRVFNTFLKNVLSF